MNDLLWNIKNGDFESVRDFFNTNPQMDINLSIDGRQLIHYAADYGQKEIIRFLLEKGANVNAIDKHGISALLAAIWENHTECVRIMLDAGADKTGKTPQGTDLRDSTENYEIKKLLS